MRSLAYKTGRIPVKILAVVRPLSHIATASSKIAAATAEVDPIASPIRAPTSPQAGSIPGSLEVSPIASPDWALASPQASSIPASPEASPIVIPRRAPVPGAIPIVNLTRITAPVPDTTPAARPVRASAVTANTAIRELVDSTIEPDSGSDDLDSSSDEADSGSDEC